jgi:hypothetical protein
MQPLPETNSPATIYERGIQNAELAVWGLKQTVLSKRREITDLEFQVGQAEDSLRQLRGEEVEELKKKRKH